MYRLLEEPFRFPEKERTETFISGQWQERLQGCAARLEFEVPSFSDLALDATTKAYEVEFIALFEVGMGGAPCPLHSGHYGKERMITMEEVLRFYRFFDYDPDRSADRFPDHINFELQFMALLAERQVAAEAAGGDVLSPLLGQRDFAARNLASWLPQLSQLIEKRTTIEFFAGAGRLLNTFVTKDAALLAARANELQPA
jgi:DMSO reductase family type II enzyme chaperone